MDGERLAHIASALASETRANMVAALMGGTAHTGQELARHVGVRPSTASEHLGVLVDAGMVTVEAQGRHRYFRLASADVAKLVETMSGVEPLAPPRPRSRDHLLFARACYDHLAGELGVRVYDRLLAVHALEEADGEVALTATGQELVDRLGIVVRRSRRRPLVRACLDWTERRHHLSGEVGAGLLTTMLDRRWIYRHPQRARELRLTDAGREALAEHLGLETHASSSLSEPV